MESLNSVSQRDPMTFAPMSSTNIGPDWHDRTG
ncbi:hypothetical protein ALC53_11324 [Atta colombica]|uniref:Uncharacterized protein n=1 Tax=Atta colombica TaxID=520822 RepID=A0A151HZW6_9HYME|nr:hypothetical protein ALC53_11324 [Atta colombica]